MCPINAAKVVLVCATLHNIARTIHRDEISHTFHGNEIDSDSEEIDHDEGTIDSNYNQRVQQLLNHFQ